MSLPPPLTLRAHAKVNLALSVGPPEPPKGYHRIASWFAPVDLHDDVIVQRLPAGTPSRHIVKWAEDAPRPTPIDWPLEKDLAVRAHRLLERHAGKELPVELTVVKRTPVGGGLGGGSSDAASALMGVNRAWGLGLGAAELRSLSMELGSDIAFFIDEPCVEGRAEVPRAAMVTGFGEGIERTPSPRGEVLLFFPPFGCPTGAVYKAFDRAPTEGVDVDRVRTIIQTTAKCGGAVDEHMLRNDLAGPACEIEPRLREILTKLQGACGSDATVHLTGSGSTLFALAGAHRVRPVLERCRKAAGEAAVLRAEFVSA